MQELYISPDEAIQDWEDSYWRVRRAKWRERHRLDQREWGFEHARVELFHGSSDD